MPQRPDTPTARARPHAQQAISLADVAALAGVSTGTVSRALSRPEMISAATRERVLAAAQRLGYVPNGAARALAMRRSACVGAIVPRFGSSSFSTMVQSLEAGLAAQGYTLLLSAPDHARADDPTILRNVIERGVDAVALLGADQAPAIHALLEQHRLPCVLLWARPGAAQPSVGLDEDDAGAQLVAHLASLGHHTVGYVGPFAGRSERARWRHEGFMRAAAAHGLRVDARATLETEHGFREGHQAMRTLLARGLDITAVVCASDYLAAGALAALDQAGVPVPQRLSVASYNDNDFAAYTHPPLTTVHLPIAEVGQAAAQLLVQLIEGRPPQPPGLLPVQLVVRGSTGPAPA